MDAVRVEAATLFGFSAIPERLSEPFGIISPLLCTCQLVAGVTFTLRPPREVREFRDDEIGPVALPCRREGLPTIMKAKAVSINSG